MPLDLAYVTTKMDTNKANYEVSETPAQSHATVSHLTLR